MSTHLPDADLAQVRHALVIGLGASGLAAARLLADRGVQVTLVDDVADHPAAAGARAAGFDVILGRPPVDLLSPSIDLVVPSPGVPQGAPVLQRAIDEGLPVWSEPELALRVFHHPLLAVTGTNGKTSTTELLVRMLRTGDRPAVACGNIGLPISDAAGSTPSDTVLVAELSSFQLRFAHTLRAGVGVLLNVADDHLDWHGDATAYGLAKSRIWIGQSGDDWAVANADDPVSVELRDRYAPGRPADFSAVGPVERGVGRVGASLVAIQDDGACIDIVRVADLSSQAPHHLANVAAAAAVAILSGVDPLAVGEAARTYTPGEHRFTTVAVHGGVRYVDDSKATNVHAAIASLSAADDIVWIAGGLAKGVDLAPLGAHLANVRAAVLIGTAADELEAICTDAGVTTRRAGSMLAAVEAAVGVAEPGTTVLLAPACASFDQFRDYADRGEQFVAAVATVAGGESAGGKGHHDGT